MKRFHRLLTVAAAVILGASVFAGALHPPSADAVEGVAIKGDASGGDATVEAVVYVSTSPARVCEGRARHAGETLRLQQLTTDDAGGGRWRWTVGADVRAGVWGVSVSCELHHGKTRATTSSLPPPVPIPASTPSASRSGR